MPSALRAVGFTLLALTFAAESARAHDGDGKLRDKRPRLIAQRGGHTSMLTLSQDYWSFPANNVQLLAWLPLLDFGPNNDNGNSCSGYVAPSGREYAILGTYRGTAFVEITDPGDPRIVALINGPTSLWRDMKVFHDKVYAVSEGGFGIQVIDVSQIDAGVVTLVNTITGNDTDKTHTVALDAQSGYLYRCGGNNNGLRIYDLANPTAPAYVTAWPDRYVHECQVVTYSTGPWAGRQIAFCCDGWNNGFTNPGLDILDVTNKQQIQLLSRFYYSGAVFSHQGWLTPDAHYFYLDDEKDDTGALPMRTRLIDVSDLAHPVELPSFTTGSHAIDHNLYAVGNRIYESNYRSGFHVFDNTNETAPVEIASFDTWPQDDNASFNGLWNNYPFFPSGNVIGSDIEKGLFVWKVGPPALDFQFAQGVPDIFAPQGALVPLTIAEIAPGTLAAGSAKLHYDAGQGWTTVDLVPQGSGFLVPFPALACGRDLAWYLTARTAAETWSFPQGAPTIVRHSTAALSLTLVTVDRMETASGWTGGVPGDTATSGRWVLGAPIGTVAQPDEDHDPAGTQCWFTGQGTPFGNGNEADVDGGATTLLSPTYDLSALAEPVISYWRWYSTVYSPAGQDDDALVVDITNDAGAASPHWTRVEQVGPHGPECVGGWILHQFKVSDFVAPTSQVALRFVASDTGAPSLVEAAIDDLLIGDIGCAPPAPVVYCSAKVNSQGCTPAIGWNGTPSASASTAFDVSASQVLSNKSGLLIYGFARASTPFQGATLCISPPIRRTPVQDSGGNAPPVDCSGVFHFDFNALVQGGSDALLVPGTTVDAQYWYRDPADPTGFGSGLSDALEFTIQP